jgi:hypothetical protein
VRALCEPPSFVCPGTQSCAACEGGACLCWVTVEEELNTETAVVVEEYVPPVDTTPPVITMSLGDGRWATSPDGSTFVFHVVSQHGVFVDPGATAADDEDGELTVSAYGAAAVSTTAVTPEVRGDASRLSYECMHADGSQRRKSCESLRFGTGRQETALERGPTPKLSRRTCTCEYGLRPCGGQSAGVAKRPRERDLPPEIP